MGSIFKAMVPGKRMKPRFKGDANLRVVSTCAGSAVVISLDFDKLLHGTLSVGHPDMGEVDDKMKHERRMPTCFCYQKCPVRWR